MPELPQGATDERFLEQAISLAARNVTNQGGPFGAVIARDGTILAEGVNRVTASADPTAHAEMEAIRAACTELNNFTLSGCVLYASCEPCPMCLAACIWAHLDRVVFAATGDDAAAAGFDDRDVRRQVCENPASSRPRLEHLASVNAGRPFDEWNRATNKIPY